MLLRAVRPLWSSLSTQLSPVAPSSCLHATAVTPRATALTGRLNEVRVADGSQTLGELELAYYTCKDWITVVSAEDTILVQRRGTRSQQCIVECSEQDEARTGYLGHSLHPSPSSSRLDLVSYEY